MPVAAAFAFARDDGATLGDVAGLDTMVTVVDAAHLLPELEGGDELAERGVSPYEDDERTVSDLLVDQVGFADVIVPIRGVASWPTPSCSGWLGRR